MDAKNIKPNSHRSKMNEKTEAKHPAKVVTGKARVKKKSKLNKAASNFISEDVDNVKSYILLDVLIPSAKKAISEIVSNGIDMLLYGEARHTDTKKRGASYVSYNKYSDKDRFDRKDRYRATSVFDLDNIFLDSRGEAEQVLSQMCDIIDEYDVVSVADLYDLVGLDYPHTANKYGWINLRNADVARTRDGYLLKLPKASHID